MEEINLSGLRAGCNEQPPQWDERGHFNGPRRSPVVLLEKMPEDIEGLVKELKSAVEEYERLVSETETNIEKAEEARYAAEKVRAKAEELRIAAEAERAASEAARQSAYELIASTLTAAENDRAAAETLRQAAEELRQSTFETSETARAAAHTAQMQSQATAYTNAEANRNGAYQEAEEDRDEIFNSKEAARDAANQAALDCADTLAALGQELGEIVDIEEIDYQNTSGHNGFINASNLWDASTIYPCAIVPIVAGEKLIIEKGNSNSDIAILKSDNYAQDVAPDFSGSFVGRIVASDLPSSLVVPADAHYLYVRKKNSLGTCDTRIFRQQPITKDKTLPSLSNGIKTLEEDVYACTSVEKTFNWGNGYVNRSGTIASSTASIFSQPVLFHAGERLKYKTNSTYQNAVVKVADNTPLSVGDTDFVTDTLISAVVANEVYEYQFTEDTYAVISCFAASYSVMASEVVAGKVPLTELSKMYPALSWVNRAIDSQTGQILVNNNRLMSSLILTRGEIWQFKLNDGYVIHSIAYYDRNERFVKCDVKGLQYCSSEKTDDIGYVRLVVRKSTSTDAISPSDNFGLRISVASSDKESLVVATFNSSYNTTDTESAREDFSSLIYGKVQIETFLLFTDPHLTPESRYETMTELVRDKYISALQKYYNSLPLDSCICLGDWLNFYHTPQEACGWLGYCDAYMRKLFRNYIPVLGNHDNNPYYPDGTDSSWLNALTYKDCENLMFRENKGTYYSIDGINTKFYVLNSGVSFIKGMTNSTYSRLVDNRWEQVDWLASKLLADDADNSIILMHIYSNASSEEEWYSEATGYRAAGIHDLGKNIKTLVTGYNNRGSVTLNGITYDFSSCSGKVAFILCGHTHFDFIDQSGDIPIVCVTNLEGGHFVDGSIVYDLVPTFDNCLVDYTNSRLYMVRVGAGVSRIVNFSTKSVSVGSSITLSSQYSGNITWATRNANVATVSNGEVTGVSSGYVGIIATDEDGKQEYWTINVV